MREPQELEDEEYEQVVERVAAVDVAKASGMVCVRVPHPCRPGKRVTKVWEVDATTNAITELADHLVRQGIQKVTVESTSDYWRPFFLPAGGSGPGCAAGQRQGGQERPGPAQDRPAGRGVAGQADRAGHAAAQLRPAVEIRQLRDYTRLRVDLTQERTRYWQRLEQAAGGRPDQGLQRGQHAGHPVGPGHAGGAGRR
jgi:transposase